VTQTQKELRHRMKQQQQQHQPLPLPDSIRQMISWGKGVEALPSLQKKKEK
jgi:hypothetical protein